MLIKTRFFIPVLALTGILITLAGCKSDDEPEPSKTRLLEETLYENDVLTRRWVYHYEMDKVAVCYVIEPLGGGGWDTTYHKVFEYPDGQTMIMTYREDGVTETIKVVYTISGDRITNHETRVYEGSQWKTIYLYSYTYTDGLRTEYLTSSVENENIVPVSKSTYSYDGGELSQILNSYYQNGSWSEVSKSVFEYLSGRINVSYDYYHDGSGWIESEKLEYSFYENQLLEKIVGFDKIADEWILGDYLEAYQYNEDGKPSEVIYQFEADDIDRWEYSYESGNGNMGIFWYGSPEWLIPVEKKGNISGNRTYMNSSRFHNR